MKNFFNEFKKFISQGSVMDLAVGVVIGSAFSAIVNSLVNDIIMPVVGLAIGGVDFTNLSITIPNFLGTTDAAVIRYGNFIQNVVTFLIIAFSLFLVIRGINRLNERAKAAADKAAKKLGKETEAKEAKEAASEDEQTKLLKAILKELKKK